MRPVSVRAIVIVSVLVVCAAFAAAETPRAVVYALQDLSTPASGTDYAAALTDTVVAALGSSGAYTVAPAQDWRTEAKARGYSDADLLDSAAALAVADGVGADLAVEGAFAVVKQGDADELVVSLHFWDAHGRRLAGSVEKTALFNLGVYLQLQGWIVDVIPTLGVAAAPPAQVVLASGKTTVNVPTVVFVGPQDGVEVSVADRVVGTVTDGELTFTQASIPAGTMLRVAKRKSGFHDAVQVVKAGARVALTPLAPVKTSGASLQVTLGELLGLETALRVYVIPDEAFAEMGIAADVQPGIKSSTQAALHFGPSLTLGSYVFFAPDSPVRLSLAVGAGGTVTAFTQPGLPTSIDYYLDLPSLTVETSILGPTLYLRVRGRYMLGIGTNLLGRGWASGGSPLVSLGVLLP